MNVSRFWWNWLLWVTVGVMVFGLAMVVMPGVILQGFGLLVYARADALHAFGAPAVEYIRLVHGVLGAVMFGWGTSLLLVVLGPLRRRSREAWVTITVSVLCWFVPDTAFSLWTGFWQNAVFNVVFAVMYAVPLLATRSMAAENHPPVHGAGLTTSSW